MTQKSLATKSCFACEAGTPPLNGQEIKKYMQQISPSWQVLENKKIKKEFKFKDFGEAMRFVNKVADIANNEGHHPDLYIFYNLVKIELWTHVANGLSENDFIMAAKIDLIKV